MKMAPANAVNGALKLALERLKEPDRHDFIAVRVVMLAALKELVVTGCTSARCASMARLPSSSLTLNTIIQLARCHYRWWQNAKKRNETFFVSMRRLTL